MENYLFVLLLSVFVLIVAFYVEQRRIQIKDELLQHENEIKKVKEELQSTRKTFSTQVNEEWEWMQKEVKQVKKERELTKKKIREWELTKKKIRELESTSFEQVSTAYGYYRLINQMRGEYVNKEVIDQIRADVNALREKLYIKKEKKDYLQPIVLCSAKYKEKKDYLQGLPAGIFRKDIGNVSVKLGETIIELIPKYEDLERTTAAGSPHLGPTDEDLERTTAAGSPHLGPTDPVRIATGSPHLGTTDEDLERTTAAGSPHLGPTDHRKMLGEKLSIMDGTPHTKLPVFGKHYWRVSEKVPGYGADLTLFCFVDDCCIRSAGWIKWNPDYKTIYVDVRNLKGTVSSKDKYATTNNKTGFSLVIKHLQEDDLNIIYSCSYGFKNSLGKLLHHSEVFKVDETTTHFADERTTTNFKDETSISHFKDETSISHFKEVTDETATALITNAYYRESENNSKSVKIICIVGAVVAVLAIIFIVKFYQRRRLASRNRRKSSEEGQVAQNQLLEKRKEEESANGTTKLGECLNSDDSEDCKSIPYSESSC